MFYFLRILRLIHIKRFVARSFKEAVASLDGEVVPLSVDQLPSLDSIAVCIDVVSLLGVIRIAVRVQGYPFAFGPAVFVFDVELPASSVLVQMEVTCSSIFSKNLDFWERSSLNWSKVSFSASVCSPENRLVPRPRRSPSMVAPSWQAWSGTCPWW